MTSISSEIGLSSSWPRQSNNTDEMNNVGLVAWAETYFSAANQLWSGNEMNKNPSFYLGPVLQNVGLATELTLKAILKGAGKTEKELRGFGHTTYDSYCAAKEYFDEEKFLRLHFLNTNHIEIPQEIEERLSKMNETNTSVKWRVYFDQLRCLDSVYSRPYISRYISPGEVAVPDAEIILTGTNILLSAMKERVTPN